MTAMGVYLLWSALGLSVPMMVASPPDLAAAAADIEHAKAA